MALSRAEEKSRRLLAKAVAVDLRTRAKPAGWKVSQGMLFREDDDWFADAWPIVSIGEPKSTLRLHLKPMSIDPVRDLQRSHTFRR